MLKTLGDRITKLKLLLLTPYPIDSAPSQRFRFEQFKPYVQELNEAQQLPFWSQKDMDVLYLPGRKLEKAIRLLAAFCRRLSHIWVARNSDVVFIHREASPIGPPIFEWILAKVLKKSIIYDFDDAIWLPNTSDVNSIAAKLKWHSKVKSICKWASAVSCGNHWLKEWAEQYNENVHYIPTTVIGSKIEDRRSIDNAGSELASLQESTLDPRPSTLKSTLDPRPSNLIVWTGSHSTLHYLKIIEKPLQNLHAKGVDFRFRYIADKSFQEAGLDIQIPNAEFVKWSKETEVSALKGACVGIMPLFNTVWEKGKCGFKLLQYMNQAVACVASNVGVNGYILNSGNGILVDSENEWEEALEKLLGNPDLASEMGMKGYERLLLEFTTEAQISSYYNLINCVKATPASDLISTK